MLSTILTASLLLAVAAVMGLILARSARTLGSNMRPQPIRIEQPPVRRHRR